MIIPPVRWGDILLRTTTRRSVSLSEREQYLLYMVLSWVQMNPETFISDYRSYDPAVINQYLDETMNSLLNETTPPAENHMQTRWDIWAEDAIRGINDAGATPTIVLNANAWYGHYWVQTPPVLNDQVHVNLWMDAGNYEIRHYCNTQNSAGKLSIYVWQMFGAGTILTPLNQVDLYSAGFTNNVIKTGTFTLTEMGEHKIVWGIPAKNASSSGYRHEWYRTLITRTGAL